MIHGQDCYKKGQLDTPFFRKEPSSKCSCKVPYFWIYIYQILVQNVP